MRLWPFRPRRGDQPLPDVEVPDAEAPPAFRPSREDREALAGIRAAREEARGVLADVLERIRADEFPVPTEDRREPRRAD